MLRRSHKKSRNGCVQCRRRHVKCDEARPSCRPCVNSDRKCSFNGHTPATTESMEGSMIAVDSQSPTPSLPAMWRGTHSALHISPLNNSASIGTDEADVNLDHMELFIHLSQEKDMFNLGFGIEKYHPSGLMLALSTSLKSPVLIHQLLAFSSRHLAYRHPERSAFYDRQPVTLQTKAISLFNTTYATAGVDRSNCVVIVLFASILGPHTLADALALRPPRGIATFMEHYIRCIETHRGIYTIAENAWSMLMSSELEPILSLSQAFTSREPVGHHCRLACDMVNISSELDDEDKESCRSALHYLQVGMDAATSCEEEHNRFHMICTWTMLLRPAFARMLSAMRPEALVILAYYSEMLYYGRQQWQVGDAGAYMLGLIIEHLDFSWYRWLESPRQTVFGGRSGVASGD